MACREDMPLRFMSSNPGTSTGLHPTQDEDDVEDAVWESYMNYDDHQLQHMLEGNIVRLGAAMQQCEAHHKCNMWYRSQRHRYSKPSDSSYRVLRSDARPGFVGIGYSTSM